VASVTSSQLANGSYMISATATDVAGNVSASSATINVTVGVTVDTAAPNAPTGLDLAAASDSGSSQTDDTTNDNTPTINGTAEANSKVELFEGTTSRGTAQANASGVWSITSSQLAEGAHQLTAKATDAAGNTSAASGALSVKIDTAKPGAPTRVDLIAASDTGASDTDNITNDNTPTFDVDAEANSTVKVYKGSDTTALGSAQANGSGVASVTSSQLANGSYMISATATDVAGNVSASSATINVTVGLTVDTTKPATPPRADLVAASDTGTSSTDNITKETLPRFTGQAEAGSKVSVYDGGQLIGEVNASSSTGTWNIQLTTPLSQGTHSITARATDAAGNVSAASSSLSITIDTTNPTIINLVIDRDPAQNSSTRDRTPLIEATITDSQASLSKSNITFFLDGANVTSFSYSKNKFSYTPKKDLSLSPPSHTVLLQVEDTAGNQANANRSFNIIR
jgi:large repetitive protein